MKRRTLLVAAGALAAAPLLRAQGPKPDRRLRLGMLFDQRNDPRLRDAFFGAMRGMGYVEDVSMDVLSRYSGGDAARLQAFAHELAQLKPDCIVVAGNVIVRAALQATRTIPIVTTTVIDPVGSGFAASLARPGGNLTGTATNPVEMVSKRMQILTDAFPRLRRLAVLNVPPGAAPARESNMREMEHAAKTLNLELINVELTAPPEFERAFEPARRARAEAVYVLEYIPFFFQRAQIVELCLKERLPMICPSQEYAEAGALLSYGVDYDALVRQAAAFVDLIFRGAKPGDLPIRLPTVYNLYINLATARKLGVVISQSLLLRADRVIE